MKNPNLEEGTTILRLYVAPGAEHSDKAIANLRRALERASVDMSVVEIIDVFEDPDRALDDGVVVTPMLIRVRPTPVRKVVGTLANEQTLMDLVAPDE